MKDQVLLFILFTINIVYSQLLIYVRNSRGINITIELKSNAKVTDLLHEWIFNLDDYNEELLFNGKPLTKLLEQGNNPDLSDLDICPQTPLETNKRPTNYYKKLRLMLPNRTEADQWFPLDILVDIPYFGENQTQMCQYLTSVECSNQTGQIKVITLENRHSSSKTITQIHLYPLGEYFASSLSSICINLYGESFTYINLGSLRQCQNLGVLHITASLTTLDLSPLMACTHLRVLELPNNHLTHLDLKPLHRLEMLEILDLEDNRLKNIDLSPLREKMKLEIIRLWNNELTEIDLSPLRDCNELYTVSLEENPLKDLDISSLTRLPYLLYAESHLFELVKDIKIKQRVQLIEKTVLNLKQKNQNKKNVNDEIDNNKRVRWNLTLSQETKVSKKGKKKKNKKK